MKTPSGKKKGRASGNSPAEPAGSRPDWQFQDDDRFRLLFEKAASALSFIDVIRDENGNLCDYRFVYVNAAYESMTGRKREQVVGKRVLEVAQEMPQDWLDMLGRVAKTGKPEEYERYSPSIRRYYHGTVIAIGPGRLALSFIDITDRKKAETELAQSREVLRSVMEATPNLVYVKDRFSRMLMANPATIEVIGKPADQVIGKTDAEFFDDPEIARATMENDQRVMESGVSEVTEEFVRSPKGDRIFLSTKSPLRDSEKNVSGVIGISQDITSRKQTEGRQRRLNRELRAISECMQAMVRAVDEHALLLNICRIICDVAGYRMAWVGYAEQNELKIVRPVAWYGREYGYLTETEISWDDTKHGREPAGRCIRSCQSCCIQNISENAKSEPWVESALQRGYQSVIALPLLAESGSTFGTLVIYAQVTDAFHPDEIILLEKLSADLAFGIISLRARTERKRVEKMLRQTNESLDVAQKAAKAGMWDWNIVTGHIDWTPHMFELFGLDPGRTKVSLEAWQGIIYPDDLQVASLRIDRALKEHTILNSDYRIVLPDGQVRWINSVGEGKYDDQGRPVRMMGICLDITERKKAELERADYLSLLQATIESSADGLLVIDTSGKVTLFNSRFVELWRIPSSLLEKRDDKILLDYVLDQLSDPQAFIAKVHELYAQPAEESFDTLAFKDGRFFERYSRPQRLDGKIVGRVWSFRDVSTRKKVEDDLQKSNLQLQEAIDALKRTQQRMVENERLKALGQMASGITHDFNNALMPIVGLSDYLVNHPAVFDDRKEALSIAGNILSASRDAVQIVKRITEFYRPDQVLDVMPLNAAKLFDDVKNMTQPKWKAEAEAEGRNVVFEIQAAADLQLYANESQLREALINLIMNSIDAMPRGGIIKLSARGDSDWRAISVSDTGMGMTEEVKLKCLEPFFSTKGKHGTGIGLSMVQGIVMRHGGTMLIESLPGKGTTVTIRLPVVTARENTTLPPKADIVVPRLNILVVDDEEWARNLIVRYLKHAGHNVEMAGTGQEAIGKFKAGKYDLVTVDKAMPCMSGDEVAHAVKAVSPGVKVLMLTGFGDTMNLEGDKPGAVDYILTKPFTFNEISSAISEVMSRHEP